MSTRKPPPRRAPTRRPPPLAPRRRKSSPSSFPWAIVIGGVLIAVACLIAGGIIAWPRLRNVAQPTPVAPQGTAAATPDAVATSVASTVQAMATSSGPTPTSSAIATPATAATGTPPPSTAVPVILPATSVDVQRDERVDPATGIATWTEPSAQAEIQVMIRRADGVALDEYVSIRRQGTDVSGNPVGEGNRVAAGWTGKDGILAEAVPPATYILDFRAAGWPWTAQFANHVVAAGQRTSVLFDLSLLTVGVRYADGNPADKFVKVSLQETNVSGDPVEGKKATDGWAGDDGLVTFELTPGTYAINVSGIAGYDTWGRFDHAVPGGGNYTVILTLGRLAVETWNPDGTLATGAYVRVYTLTTDSNGDSVFADSVDDHRSDNTGRAVFDLVPGVYGVQVEHEIELLDIPVQPGQVTVVNQTGYTIP